MNSTQRSRLLLLRKNLNNVFAEFASFMDLEKRRKKDGCQKKCLLVTWFRCHVLPCFVVYRSQWYESTWAREEKEKLSNQQRFAIHWIWSVRMTDTMAAAAKERRKLSSDWNEVNHNFGNLQRVSIIIIVIDRCCQHSIHIKMFFTMLFLCSYSHSFFVFQLPNEANFSFHSIEFQLFVCMH